MPQFGSFFEDIENDMPHPFWFNINYGIDIKSIITYYYDKYFTCKYTGARKILNQYKLYKKRKAMYHVHECEALSDVLYKPGGLGYYFAMRSFKIRSNSK